jgi:hypothetical protein
MKRETLKEIGKYHLDISKILAGLSIVSPIIKDESVSLYAFGFVGVVVVIGFIFINKGAKDE